MHSVRQRLLNRSRATGEDYNLLLSRYAVERLLYRLSQSNHADEFILKGAMLFAAWTGSLHRPTRDLDLLGFGEPSAARLVEIFHTICEQRVDEDGMAFDAESVVATPIRDEHLYAGLRLRIASRLGNARIDLQVDVGFGDVVTPDAERNAYPTLLDLPAPRLRMYPPETVVAEKLEAMVSLGITNSRMKDYYDTWLLLDQFELKDEKLAAAIRATFERRGTSAPQGIPLGLSEEFAQDSGKQAQWAGFLKRSNLAPSIDLPAVVNAIRQRLLPLLVHRND